MNKKRELFFPVVRSLESLTLIVEKEVTKKKDVDLVLKNIKKIFCRYFWLYSAILIILIGIDHFRGESNLKINANISSTYIITDNPRMYGFNYAMDMFKSEYLSAKDSNTRKRIDYFRRKYYDSIVGTALKTNEKFENGLKNYNYNMSYFNKFE